MFGDRTAAAQGYTLGASRGLAGPWTGLWAPGAGAGGAEALAARLARALAIVRERRALAELEPRLLADIGVTREAALREAGRSPFDAPRRR